MMSRLAGSVGGPGICWLWLMCRTEPVIPAKNFEKVVSPGRGMGKDVSSISVAQGGGLTPPLLPPQPVLS